MCQLGYFCIQQDISCKLSSTELPEQTCHTWSCAGLWCFLLISSFLTNKSFLFFKKKWENKPWAVPAPCGLLSINKVVIFIQTFSFSPFLVSGTASCPRVVSSPRCCYDICGSSRAPPPLTSRARPGVVLQPESERDCPGPFDPASSLCPSARATRRRPRPSQAVKQRRRSSRELRDD